MLELEPKVARTAAPKGARAYPGGVRVSVIIPTLNEAENMPHVIARIPGWVYEVILVDGRSTDNTVEVAKGEWPNRHIVERERRTGRERRTAPRLISQERRGDGVMLRLVAQTRRGKGNALHSGVAAATGDIVVMLDADGSTDPQEIGRFVEALLAGADFAKGSRFLRGAGTSDMPLYRKVGNGGLVLLTNILFGTRYTDITYGYNAFWRRHAGALALEIDGWANEIVTNIRVARHGLRVVEVPSFEHCRIAGEAKLNAWSAGMTILKAILAERLRPSPRKAGATAAAKAAPVVPLAAAEAGEGEGERAVPA